MRCRVAKQSQGCASDHAVRVVCLYGKAEDVLHTSPACGLLYTVLGYARSQSHFGVHRAVAALLIGL